METADLEMCSLQAFRRLPNVHLNPDVSSEAEQEQQDEPEPDIQPDSDQETPELMSGPLTLVVIKSRIRWLHNRRFLLLKMLQVTEKAEQHSGSSTEELTSEGSDNLCELEAIQTELEELQVKKEELEMQERGSKLQVNGGPQVDPTLYTNETPFQLTQENITSEQSVRPMGPVVPVDSLGQAAAVTKCPSCQEVIVTETHSTVGETMWLSCCLCAAFGCVAGCCLIPFCMESLKNVQHHCPRCQEEIHTHHPL